jgi:hypothetical protein
MSAEPDPHRARQVLATTCGATSMAFFDATIVNIAFPDIRSASRIPSLATLSWRPAKRLSRRREMYPRRIAPYRRPVSSPRSVRATSSRCRGSGRIDAEG